jgi:hypothetical protein
MMHNALFPSAAAFLIALALAGCNTQATKCTFFPEPLRPVDLVFPVPGSTAVPTGIGVLVVQGDFSSFQSAFGGSLTLNLTTQLGSQVASGPIGAAPSPLPSPLATPFAGLNLPFGGVTIPMLQAATTYVVTFTHNDQADNPPSCVAPTTVTLGSFTTH